MYICVEATLTCPIMSLTAIRFAPPFIRAVAKLCLRVWGCTFFVIPTLLAVSFIIWKTYCLVSFPPLWFRKMYVPDALESFILVRWLFMNRFKRRSAPEQMGTRRSLSPLPMTLMTVCLVNTSSILMFSSSHEAAFVYAVNHSVYFFVRKHHRKFLFHFLCVEQFAGVVFYYVCKQKVFEKCADAAYCPFLGAYFKQLAFLAFERGGGNGLEKTSQVFQLSVLRSYVGMVFLHESEELFAVSDIGFESVD